jgi:PhoH-like ATPase
MHKKKVFVLDTNIILHDSNCIKQFENNDILIPMPVIEELDRFKKGTEIVNYHARNFLADLDTYSTKSLFNGGVSLGKDKGNIYVRLHVNYAELIKQQFTEDTPDHRILNLCYITAANNDVPVILVTKDVNLRIKAKAIGILAEDYTTDQIIVDDIEPSIKHINNVCKSDIDKLFNKKPLEIKEIPNNGFGILQCTVTNSNALVFNSAKQKKCIPVSKKTISGIKPRNAEQTLAFHALLDNNIPLVAITGKAGTGKTLLALASALHLRKNYLQILLTRPIVPLSGKDIGYLPGDIESKIKPFMQPLFDNLQLIKKSTDNNTLSSDKINKMVENDKIIIEPLTYIRGRSLIKKIIIIDESQNLTPHEVKTAITRAGEGTKIILTGDIHQIDHLYLDIKTNGLSYLIDKMNGHDLFAHINLEKGERSELAEVASKLL